VFQDVSILIDMLFPKFKLEMRVLHYDLMVIEFFLRLDGDLMK
jgi:hypothetical protein